MRWKWITEDTTQVNRRTSGTLTVSARDLGPIVAGTVDLKPLTIFMGQSNTGKSYMAAGIYALMTASADDELPPYPPIVSSGLAQYRYRRGEPWISGLPRDFASEEGFPEVLRTLREWALATENRVPDGHQPVVADLPIQVQDALGQSIRHVLNYFCGKVAFRLHNVLGGTTGFIRKGQEPIEPGLAIRQSEPNVRLDITLKGSVEPVIHFEISQIPLDGLASRLRYFLGSRTEDEQRTLVGHYCTLVASVIEQALGDMPLQSFYLPAARSGITQGQKVLAASLVRRSARIGLEPINIPSLPVIATEFLSHLVGLEKPRQSQPDLDQAIAFVEKEVLHGGIDFADSSNLPHPEIIYEQTGVGPIPLDHTSSMVSEIASLILFLKYLVSVGDLLILEEPESHLHPAAQRQMARGIMRLVNAGVRVIITTHSDMFISQINNLIRMSHASERWATNHGFRPEDSLREDQIGAFLFQHDQVREGSLIRRLKVDPDTGIDDEEFVNEIEYIYEETIKLQRIRPN